MRAVLWFLSHRRRRYTSLKVNGRLVKVKRLEKRPLQIYLEPRQDQVLRHLAETRGVYIAELIRDSIDLYLEALPPEEEPTLGLIGIASGGPADLSENHDEHLASLAMDTHQG